MRERHVRDRLNFLNFEYPRVRLPLVESIQRVMVRAEVFRQTVRTDCSLKDTAQRDSVHCATLNAKPENTTGELVHDHEDLNGFSVSPIRSETDRCSTNRPSCDREM